jgi:hypothetical protein
MLRNIEIKYCDNLGVNIKTTGAKRSLTNWVYTVLYMLILWDVGNLFYWIDHNISMWGKAYKWWASHQSTIIATI